MANYCANQNIRTFYKRYRRYSSGLLFYSIYINSSTELSNSLVMYFPFLVSNLQAIGTRLGGTGDDRSKGRRGQKAARMRETLLLL